MSTNFHLLILGAGFSRNWGGWLASEAFEYLIGCSELDEQCKRLLWKHKDREGFEGALGELQSAHKEPAVLDESSLGKMQAALLKMFADMDRVFAQRQFEFSNSKRHSVAAFLSRFDQIYTLNQDTLLERFYTSLDISLLGAEASGVELPGMQIGQEELHPLESKCLAQMFPANDKFNLSECCQPIFKLHGSWNWRSDKSSSTMVLGTQKSRDIQANPILKRYSEEFSKALRRVRARLMIIGYGFRDYHINSQILRAIEEADLSLFIVDPIGVDILNENRAGVIASVSDRAKVIYPKVIGASRRPLSQIFDENSPEFEKVMRFFA